MARSWKQMHLRICVYIVGKKMLYKLFSKTQLKTLWTYKFCCSPPTHLHRINCQTPLTDLFFIIMAGEICFTFCETFIGIECTCVVMPVIFNTIFCEIKVFGGLLKCSYGTPFWGVTVLLYGELPFSYLGSYHSLFKGVTFSYPRVTYSHCMQSPALDKHFCG